MSSSAATHPPSPLGIFQMMNAFQQTAALRAAVELELFSHIGAGDTSAAEMARAAKADARGMGILADYLVVHGLLTKSGDRYGLTPESGLFLDKRSPAYIGGAVEWHGMLLERGDFNRLTDAVRHGGAPQVIAQPDVWVVFARAMAPMMRMPAAFVAEHLAGAVAGGGKVLDIAGGHGLYGIAVAQRHKNAEITLVDAEPVTAVAIENATAAGVADRYHTLPGSALPGSGGEVDFGDGYKLILITGFLHHFSPEVIEALLRKARAALAPGGQVIALDFVPNPDRVSPPMPASFSLIMLAETAHGQAYTFDEYQRMFAAAGFPKLERRDLPGLPMTALTTIAIS